MAHKNTNTKAVTKSEPVATFFPTSERPGTLIIVEGCDGSGKSTQLIILQKLLEANGFINALFAKTFDQVSIIPTFFLTPLSYLG